MCVAEASHPKRSLHKEQFRWKMRRTWLFICFPRSVHLSLAHRSCELAQGVGTGCQRSFSLAGHGTSSLWQGSARTTCFLKVFQAWIDEQAQFNSSCNNKERVSLLCAADPWGEVENCHRNKRDLVRSKYLSLGSEEAGAVWLR